MKKVSLLIVAIVAFSLSYSQECSLFMINKEGVVTETTYYDKKGKAESVSRTEYKSIITEGNKQTYKIQVTNDFGGKDESVFDYEATCEDGNIRIDSESLIAGNSQMANSESGMKVEIESEDILYPKDLIPGTQLPNAKLNVSVKMDENMPMAMTTTFEIKNRKVVGNETITTSAGSFECVKIEYDFSIKLGLKQEYKACEWLAKGAGVVKSETYTKNGKLFSYSELTKISQ